MGEFSGRRGVVGFVLLWLTACSIAGDPGTATQDDLTGPTLAQFPKYIFTLAKTKADPKASATPNVGPETVAALNWDCSGNPPLEGTASFSGEAKVDLGQYSIPPEFQELFEKELAAKVDLVQVPIDQQVTFTTQAGSCAATGYLTNANERILLAPGSALRTNGRRVEAVFSVDQPTVQFEQLPLEIRNFKLFEDQPLFEKGGKYSQRIRVQLAATVDTASAQGSYEMTMGGEKIGKFFEGGGKLRADVEGRMEVEKGDGSPEVITTPSATPTPSPTPADKSGPASDGKASKPGDAGKKPDKPKPVPPPTTIPAHSPSIPPSTGSTAPVPPKAEPASTDFLWPFSEPPVEESLTSRESYDDPEVSLKKVRDECGSRSIQRLTVVGGVLEVPGRLYPKNENSKLREAVDKRFSTDARIVFGSLLDVPFLDVEEQAKDHFLGPQDFSYVIFLCAKNEEDFVGFLNLDVPTHLRQRFSKNNDLPSQLPNLPPNGWLQAVPEKEESRVEIRGNEIATQLVFRHFMPLNRLLPLDNLAQNSLRKYLGKKTEWKRFPRKLTFQGILEAQPTSTGTLRTIIRNPDPTRVEFRFNLRIEYPGSPMLGVLPFEGFHDPKHENHPLNAGSEPSLGPKAFAQR